MIRAATFEDAAAIAAIYSPYVLEGVATFEDLPPSAAEIAGRMTTGHPWLVAGEDGVVGYAYAGPHHGRPGYRWSINVSVYLAREACGRGIGRLLYGELLPLLARLGYVNAYAGIALPNAASIGLHEAMGFAPVGVYRHVGYKLGRWHDVGWWERPIAELPAVPAEPERWDGNLR